MASDRNGDRTPQSPPSYEPMRLTGMHFTADVIVNGQLVKAGTVIEFAIPQAARSEITPTAHTDHPLRHFDRTCPACVEEQNAATQVPSKTAKEPDHPPAVAAPSAGTPRTDALRFSYQRRAAELGRSLGPEDALDLAADFEHSLTAANEQIERLKAESARTPRTGTHWPGCGMDGGPRHYECLQRDFERLKAELAEARFRPMGDNHHNALTCPYCNPRGLQFAESATQPTADTARLDLIERTQVYPWRDFGCWKFRLGKEIFSGETVRDAIDAALAAVDRTANSKETK